MNTPTQRHRRRLREYLPADVSDEMLDRIHQETIEQTQQLTRFGRLLLVASVGIVFSVLLSMSLYSIWPALDANRWSAALTQGVSVGVGIWLAMWLLWRPYTTIVREAARRHGYDICLKCGYTLENLPAETQQCPECGTKREPVPAAGSE